MSSTDPTAAARARAYRARKRGQLEPIQLCDCGRPIHGDRLICRRCWLLTPEGREWNRERVAAIRARQREQQQGQGPA